MKPRNGFRAGDTLHCVALSAELAGCAGCACFTFVEGREEFVRTYQDGVEFLKDVTESEFKAWIVEFSMREEK